MHDDVELARLLQAEREKFGDRGSLGSIGSPAWLGRVTTPTASVQVGKFLLARPQSLLGTEAEGAAGVSADLGTDDEAVYLVGPGKPAENDQVIVRWSDWRWVTSRRPATGGTTGPFATLPGCACTAIPTTLYMSAAGPCGEETFPTCTFVYGPTPADLSGADLGDNCFLSVETFLDAFSGTDYKLHLGCDSVFVRLSRVYYPAGGNPAFQDATLYAWSIGQPGNTCDPFLLSNGMIYPGGNPACDVVVTE